MRRPPAVGVPDRVDVLVAVHPAGSAVSVAEGDLGPVGHGQRLTSHDGTKAALQTRLKVEIKNVT
jgi:hypothetical protein